LRSKLSGIPTPNELIVIVASEFECVERECSQDGCTPAYLAAQRHLEVVRYLLEECGADVNANARDEVGEFD
jgi:hypothetical protein